MASNQKCSVINCHFKGDIAKMYTLKLKDSWPRKITGHEKKQLSKYSLGYICPRCRAMAEKIVGDGFFLKYSDHAPSSMMMAAFEKAGLI